MNKIKLKVPGEPKAEMVAQGNFYAELEPNSTIEVEDRDFADWLVNAHGLTETTEAKPAPTGQTETEKLLAEYPADFPHRKVLVNAGIPYQTTIGLDRDALIAVNGIGKSYADEILAFEAEPKTENTGFSIGGENTEIIGFSIDGENNDDDKGGQE